MMLVSEIYLNSISGLGPTLTEDMSGGDDVTAQSADRLTKGDIADFASRIGYIYIEIKVTYGEGYITRICDEYALDSKGPPFDQFNLCSDPHSNCTDADVSL